ncbi:MAG: hypothetical protein JOY71_12010 [Acetobacteraceae bacterium]|nr:hypothetical protein [Acetobacteraceae bacterium]
MAFAATLGAPDVHELISPAEPIDDPVPTRYRAAKILDAPWSLATGSDRQILEPQTSRPVLTRALEWYLNRLHVAARIDPVAATAFIRVIGLVDAPHTILRPNVIARVLRQFELAPPWRARRAKATQP